jgi:photosystem II stability/assembly factor-like uncharacterized protein
MGVYLFRTDNGGNSWTDISSNDIHVDHHAMIFDEVNNRVIEGNDGGLYISENYGNNWAKINNLPLTQFYAIDIDYKIPARIYGGTQDNNTIRTMTGGTSDWEAILGGDGMYTLVDYTNSNVIYAEYQWGNLYRSTNGGSNMTYISGPMAGDRVNWSAPLAMHPVTPATLYFGTYRVWKSTNRGSSWQAVSEDLTAGINQYFYTITTIEVSKVNPSIVLAGTGDGKVHISTDDGVTWQNISAGLPNRWITKVAFDPFDEQTIYVTLSGFRWDEPLPHVYKSTNLGSSWTNISGNLPEFPVNDIALDPDVPGKIIVGTDAGVYGTSDGGQSWSWIWNGLPAVPVCALKIHAPTRTIVAGTYGLSTYKANLDDIMTGIPAQKTNKTIALSVSPNPVSTRASITFHLPAADDIKVYIYGMNGALLQVVFSGNLAGGTQTITWNPERSINGENNEFRAGLYLVKIEGNRYAAATKVVKY